MLRRTKIIIAAYCTAGLVFLAFTFGFVLQMRDWHGHPERYKEFTHQHHHGEEIAIPETSPVETYAVGAKTYMKVPFMEDFDVTQSCVDLKQIVKVNLNLENFPDLEELQFVSPEKVVGIPDRDSVLGVNIEGEQKAYPIRMLNYHVVLNDVCGGKEIAVVWDPLIMTPKVFRRRVERSDGATAVLTFGKLGFIHKGGLLLYDEPTRGAWWPPEGKCLAGELSGVSLPEYPFLLVSWKVWKQRYPTTAVLSTNTPFRGKYNRNWFSTYYGLSQLPIPIKGWAGKRSPLKWSETVIVLETQGKPKAYPLSVLTKAEGTLEDTLGGRRIVFRGAQSPPPYPTDEKGQVIPYSFGAWFLWSVRYPDIELYSPESVPK